MARELPPSLEDRIVTTSAMDYMRTYKLNPKDFDLVGVYYTHISKKLSGLAPLIKTAYEGLKREMETESYIAVTDLEYQK